MGIKVVMRRQIIALAVAGLATTAHAQCYVRSAITNQTTINIANIADVQPLVVPISATHNKCIVNFRAQVNGQWITAEGENTGPKTMSEKALCRGAMDQGRTQIMSHADGGSLAMEQNMVCTDQKIPEVRKVTVGERVKESEVLPHPNFLKRFGYRATICRWFIEPEVVPGDLLNRQGIVCRINDNEWQVVDKW